MKTWLSIGGIIGCFATVGMLIGRTIPVVHTTTYRTEYKQDTPVDPSIACNNSRVKIISAEAQQNDKGEWNTWVDVVPVGDSYTVTCVKRGGFDYKKGSVYILNAELY